MSHTCSSMVIHCMDFRFGPGLFNFLTESKLLGDADITGWAGAGKPFLSDEWKGFVMKQVETSRALHSISEVHLIQHIDCGAYGGSATWENDFDTEWKDQLSQIDEVRKVIQARYPNMKVTGHIAVLEGHLESTVYPADKAPTEIQARLAG